LRFTLQPGLEIGREPPTVDLGLHALHRSASASSGSTIPFNVEIAGRTIGLRFGEIELPAPFRFASYNTTGALRKIEYRELPPAGK
jgi:hypothetical protein